MCAEDEAKPNARSFCGRESWGDCRRARTRDEAGAGWPDPGDRSWWWLVTRPRVKETQQASRVADGSHGPGRLHEGANTIGGEFDPGSGSTLAACLMHASRTGSSSDGLRGGRVRNTWVICPVVGASPRKRGVIPHTVASRVGGVTKAVRRRRRSPRPISLLVG